MFVMKTGYPPACPDRRLEHYHLSGECKWCQKSHWLEEKILILTEKKVCFIHRTFSKNCVYIKIYFGQNFTLTIKYIAHT